MIDFTKPVQTRDGRKVRILCTDRASDQAVVGLVMMDHCGKEELHSWGSDGSRHFALGSAPIDLINVPERVERWLMRITDAGRWQEFPVRQLEADGSPVSGQIRVTYEDGAIVGAVLEDCK